MSETNIGYRCATDSMVMSSYEPVVGKGGGEAIGYGLLEIGERLEVKG